MARTITGEAKREGQKMSSSQETKKRRRNSYSLSWQEAT